MLLAEHFLEIVVRQENIVDVTTDTGEIFAFPHTRRTPRKTIMVSPNYPLAAKLFFERIALLHIHQESVDETEQEEV